MREVLPEILTPYPLRPYQEEAVRSMIRFLGGRKATYNASEMGLGKTIQTIAVLNTLGLKKVLIVCPAIMRLVWRQEYLKWSTLKGQKIAVVLSKKDLPATQPADIIIISYDLLATETAEKILLKEYEAIVCDEAHYLKNRGAKRTKAILGKYWKKAKYKIFLSGTPFTKSVVDTYPVWSLILPEVFGNFNHFAHSYTNVRFNGFGRTYEGVKNADRLSKIIRDNFFIRYRKDEVEKEIPEKVFIKIPLPRELRIEVPKEDVVEIEAELKELESSLDPKIKPTAKIIKNRREQGLRKVDSVIEFVTDLLEQNIPVVLFAWHTDVIAKLQEGLKKYPLGVITGATSAKLRQSHIEEFQEGKLNLIIANILAGGVGITLTRASTCVFAEFDYSPATLSQAISRLHRIGQKNSVNIYYLLVEDSLEERILQIVMRKVETFEKVLE